MSHLEKLARLCVATGLASACTLDEPPAESSIRSSLACSVFYCGDNAPTAGDGLIFDELDLFHRPNHAGVRLLGAKLDRVGLPALQLKLDIDGHWLFAIDQFGSRVEGPKLEGTIIYLQYEQGTYSETFELLIEDVIPQSGVTFAAGAPDSLPIYLIKSRRQAKMQKSFDFYVCNNSVLPVDPLWTADGHYALFYRGDRYDPADRSVAPNDPADGWSFLACAGGAGAKMHLHRHTHAGAFNRWRVPEYWTAPEERTALLKAITADYCGDGRQSFTVAGQPLVLTAATSFMPAVNLSISTGPVPPALGVRSFEAIWSPTGPVCLDHPRREPPPGAPRPPDTWTRDEVIALCGGTPIPTCDAAMASWWSYGYAVTANPW